jgi:hypothetical protein
MGFPQLLQNIHISPFYVYLIYGQYTVLFIYCQENSFYDFARNRGQYDETALAGLRTAIANRINAVKEGRSFDADGVLEGDVVDNTSIQTQKKGLLRKEKYVD